MEGDIILNQPTERCTQPENTPGPPGAENDVEIDEKLKTSKESKSGRHRSSSISPRRKSPTRSRHSPSRSRNRRSPSPYRRRNRRSRSRKRESPIRSRNYVSPDRRRGGYRERSRYSPDRNRRDVNRRDDRYRRGRRDSRSRSDSPKRRWSPTKKTITPPAVPPPPAVSMTDPMQYGVPTPAPIFNNSYGGYNQYAMAQFAPVPDYVSAPPPPSFNTAYGLPPSGWGVHAQPSNDYGIQASWPVQTTEPAMQQEMLQSEPQLESSAHQNAVAKEAEIQREQMITQRNGYLQKASALKKELKLLKEQRKDLKSDAGPPSPTTKGFLDENDRLQIEIKKKLDTIENVIDMLTGIIGEKNTPLGEGNMEVVSSVKKEDKKTSSSSSSSSASSSGTSSSEDDSSPERLKKEAIESMNSKRTTKETKPLKEAAKMAEAINNSKQKQLPQINYSFFDPELHWCQICNVFPKTAKEYLTHLHSKEHIERNVKFSTPWHGKQMVYDEFPKYQNARTERVPIRGLQFFVPATSWYCTICNYWMGDLHCASLHLKSQEHSKNYSTYIENQPNFENEWLSSRQQAIEMKSLSHSTPAPPLITPTRNADGLNSITLQTSKAKSSDVEKSSKRKKKKSDDKKDKKKKKRSKKRKRNSTSSSSSSEDSSSDSESKKVVHISEKEAKEMAERAASIRVAMRNITKSETDSAKFTSIDDKNVNDKGASHDDSKRVPQQQHEEDIGLLVKIKEEVPDEDRKKDELMMAQWNTVQPVISESEKKLLEQLKGKLKNKSVRDDVGNGTMKTSNKSPKRDDNKENLRSRSPGRRESNGGNDRLRERSRSRGATRRSHSRGRRSRSRGHRRVSRSRSRGRFRRSRSRGGRRSRSRGRFTSPVFGRRRRRSRSYDRRRRSISKSHSRSRSRSPGHRIEKAIVKHSAEFKPRVPENKKTTKVKVEESERKKSPSKKSNSSTSHGKKLPFIGRMPVFKKQPQNNEADKKDMDDESDDIKSADKSTTDESHQLQYSAAHGAFDNFSQSMMVDYDDLMPDPVQFVSLMGAPPPPPSNPPPQYVDDKDILPPGIDESESEFVPKPISDAPIAREGPLPKDFEEALNIIFPGEKKSDDGEKKSSGETTIINDEPIMQTEELAKEGIHVLSVEEASIAALDEASQMSMNEPLIFKSQGALSTEINTPHSSQDAEDIKIQTGEEMEIISETLVETSPKIDPGPPSPTDSEKQRRQEELDDLAMLGIDANDLAAQCM